MKKESKSLRSRQIVGYDEHKESEIEAWYKNLSPKFVGPFLVVKEINKVVFKLPHDC